MLKALASGGEVASLHGTQTELFVRPGPPSADRMHQRQNRCLECRIGDLGKGVEKLEGPRRRHQFGQRIRFRPALRTGGHALEKRRDWHIQGCSDLRQTAGPYAIDALLVLLDLLERDADLVRKLGLRQPSIETKQPNPMTDRNVNVVCPFAAHSQYSFATDSS